MRCFATKRALPRAKLLATTAIGVALTAAAIAQGRLEFEVAAIRPVAGDVLPRLGYDLRGISNGRLLIRALPARELIEWAYPEFRDSQRVLGGPPWIRTTLFEIEAIFDAGILTRELPTNPGGSIPGVPQAVTLMMRSLLEDRFGFTFHVEELEMTIAALALARPDGGLGPDLRRSRTNCSELVEGRSPCGVRQKDPTVAVVEGRGVPFVTFMGMLHLGIEFDGPLRNMTGLEGLFDFEFPVRPQIDGASLLSRLTPRYGLKIERRRTRERVLVVDEIKEPSPN